MSDSDDTPEPSRSFSSRLQDGFSYLWRKVTRRDEDHSARDAIEELIEEDSQTNRTIEPDERELLGNVLGLHELVSEDIMIPRAEIVAVPVDTPAAELIKIMAEKKLSRIPVYRDTLDDVIGFAHIKDVLYWTTTDAPFVLSNMVREVMIISPSMRSTELLIKMRETGTKMAMVVDEFGGIDGLVTMSDLIEEIIGEVSDATEKSKTHLLVQRSDGSIIADARVTISDLEENLGLHLKIDDEYINTIGGLAASAAGKVPQKGERVATDYGVEIEILEADERRVRKVRLKQNSSFDLES